MMKNTKTAAMPTVVIDAKIIEAIAYNIAAMAQIQPSMSEPADVSLLLPSSDPLLMKDTKTAAVPTVVIDAKIAVTLHTTACCSMQVVDITLAEPASTNITSLRMVQQKHCGPKYKLIHIILQTKA
jgi:hypothetical protein